jgi:hypothetical protein
VLLVTKNTKDIPFDLKHRQHIAYGNSIARLKSELVPKLRWAIQEAKRRTKGVREAERISVRLEGVDLFRTNLGRPIPQIGGYGLTYGDARHYDLNLEIRNQSDRPIEGISHIYVFCDPQATIKPVASVVGRTDFGPDRPAPIKARKEDSTDGLGVQYRLGLQIGRIPPGATEVGRIAFQATGEPKDHTCRLRLHVGDAIHDFYFKVGNMTFADCSPT